MEKNKLNALSFAGEPEPILPEDWIPEDGGAALERLEQEPEGGGQQPGLPERKLLLQLDGDQREVDVNAMSDDELRELLQKGMLSGQGAAAAGTDAAPPAARTEGGPKRNIADEVQQLRTLFPELQEMPEEVAAAVARGVPLVTAYLAWQGRDGARTADALRKENRVLKQNASAAARAPVRGVAGGDSAAAKRKSGFEAGFDAGLRW